LLRTATMKQQQSVVEAAGFALVANVQLNGAPLAARPSDRRERF